MHRCALNIKVLPPPQEEIQGRVIRGAWGPGDWSTMTNACAVLVAKDHFGKCWMVAVFSAGGSSAASSKTYSPFR
jgi:hypothetical protein